MEAFNSTSPERETNYRKVMQLNKNFQQSIKTLRRFMPNIAWGVLIFVYAVSAAVSGIFLGDLMTGVYAGTVLGIFIGCAIQITRGTVVFFGQLNPLKPNYSYMSEAVAVFMGALSIFEIYKLTSAVGMHYVVSISLGVLMFMGILVEIYILSQIKFITGLELMNNPQAVKQLYKYYDANAKMKAYLDKLIELEQDDEELEQDDEELESLKPENSQSLSLAEPAKQSDKLKPTIEYTYTDPDTGEVKPAPMEMLLQLGVLPSPNGNGAHV